ncbi:hypothetical protein IT570_00235 [Candidatus Sumerlaeota bacterium]|nr:hypothetical protein [Candidatus Sumerlaeota bacterium]
MDPTTPGDGPKQLSIHDVLRARQQEGGGAPPPPPPQQPEQLGHDALPPPPPPPPAHHQETPRAPGNFPFGSPGTGPASGAPPPPQWAPPPNDPNLPEGAYLDDPVPLQSATPLKAVAAAASAAFGSMIGWAICIVIFRAEIGIVAILSGYSIGAAANRFGGRGTNIALICAALAFASIFFGRFFGVIWSQDKEAIETYEIPMDRDLDFAAQTLAETGRTVALSAGLGDDDVRDYQKVTTHDELLDFMVRHGYTTASRPEDVTEEEITEFNEQHAEALLNAADKPKAEVAPKYTARGTSPLSIYWQHFGPYDIAFFVFGMGLAFYFGGRRDAEA